MKREEGHLYYCQHSWGLLPEDCPCDLHFVEYLRLKEITGKTIFHFGTGEHHLVGTDNLERGNPNEIMGITASYQPRSSRSKEYETYLKFIFTNPAASNHYKVMFTDVYTLSPSLLPNFDIVTLFHLYEFYDDHYSSYARLDDLRLLEMFLSKLNSGGKVMFFPTTAGDPEAIGERCRIAKKRTVEIIDEFVSQGRMVVEDTYKSLVICGVDR